VVQLIVEQYGSDLTVKIGSPRMAEIRQFRFTKFTMFTPTIRNFETKSSSFAERA